MAAETCPAAHPLFLCGVRGCTEHEAWTVAEIDWRKPRKKRTRHRSTR
jgi:hypothetical protein